MVNNITRLDNGDFKVDPLKKGEVIVWSKNNCVYCTKAKNLLSEEKIGFEERNIEGGAWSLDQLLSITPGVRTFPQIFMDGKHIGGFDDLEAYVFFKGDLYS